MEGERCNYLLSQGGRAGPRGYDEVIEVESRELMLSVQQRGDQILQRDQQLQVKEQQLQQKEHLVR